ncbi:tetratricopeptide repeat protein [Phenylobacterium immobile]|uniref:tetratricopeptide repeat protein n=1 Tax=Phenylobacterium immobile TaxID=21 RepID=UPI000AA3EC27|nr:tetratricopeptide repeat protein [Phenylobacterium immobile]
MPQQALQAYDALLAVAPNDSQAVLNAARAAQASGDNGRAERLMKRAVSLRPNDPELYYQLGQFEQGRGRDRAALAAFRRADALIRSGRSQGLMGAMPNPGVVRGGPAIQPGMGILGPNPFAGRPAAALPSSNFTAASAYPMAQPAAYAAAPFAAGSYAAPASSIQPLVNPAYSGQAYPAQNYAQALPMPVADPVYAAPAYAQPAYAPAQYAQQAYPQPAYGQPVYAQAPYGQPTYGQPVYSQQQPYPPQVYGPPTYAPPAYGQQAYPQPVYPQIPNPQPVYAQPATPALPAGSYASNAQAAEYLPNMGQPTYGYGAAIPANGQPYPAATPGFAMPQPVAGGAYAQYPQAPATGYGAPGYAAAGPGLFPGLGGEAVPQAELPLPARINREIADLRESTAPQIEGSVSVRTRSGEAGASQLFEVAPRMEASFSPFGVGRLGLAVEAMKVVHPGQG